MSEVMAKAFELETLDKVLVVAVSTRFVWADIEEMEFGVAVTTDDDMPRVERLAEDFAVFF